MASRMREAIARHTTPGTTLLLVAAAVAFAPRIWDTIIGEPHISVSLIATVNRDGAPGVEQTILTNRPVSGIEVVRVEDSEGELLCSRAISDHWSGEIKRFWHFQAFTACAEPVEPYRVCTHFSLVSESGRERQFAPSCTALTTPRPSRPHPG